MTVTDFSVNTPYKKAKTLNKAHYEEEKALMQINNSNALSKSSKHKSDVSLRMAKSLKGFFIILSDNNTFE